MSLGMRKPLSSCFDCILLRKHPNEDLLDVAYWCAGYNKILTYDLARTPNDCPKKKNEEAVQLPHDEILAEFYEECCAFAEWVGRPFTMRELFENIDYQNKNSLWELLEALVRVGKIEKVDATIRTWGQVMYKVKSYWPKEWNSDTGKSRRAS
jgi:hypothetical protein